MRKKNKKVGCYYALFALLLLGCGFVFVEKNMVAYCPEFEWIEIDFDICENQNDQSTKEVLLAPVDTIFKNESLFFLFDPVFKATPDESEKWINLCFGSEEIVQDSIVQVEFDLIYHNEEEDLKGSLFVLPSDQKYYTLQGHEPDVGGDLSFFKQLFNETNSGRGDFYTSIFDLWSFGFKVSDEISATGVADIRLIFTFESEKKLSVTKSFFLSSQY